MEWEFIAIVLFVIFIFLLIQITRFQKSMDSETPVAKIPEDKIREANPSLKENSSEIN